jgi:acyl carrier protein
MGNQTIEAKVKDIVADELGVDRTEISSQSHFQDDLGADSLDLVQITMEIEDAFKIEVKEAEKITTFGQAVSYVRENYKGGEYSKS